jgi:hypothetical protein
MQVVYALVFLAIAAAAWMVVSAMRRRRMRLNVTRATDSFVRNRVTLESDFCFAANVTGKPRGLRWLECSFQSGMLLARDRATGEWLGLVPVTIRFEALPGGGMEDVEAVGNLRAATAVLTWTGREWTTAGRAIFNLEPREVLERYQESLEPIVAL